MKRVRILVEGDTELRFVQQVMAQEFVHRCIILEPFKAPTGINRFGGAAKGGGRSFKHYENSIRKAMAAEGHKPDVVFSTMLDLYALPTDFPGAPNQSTVVSGVNLAINIETALSNHFNNSRFIPYLQVHEFEALIFSELAVLSEQGVAPNALKSLNSDVAGLSPEEINKSPQGAPSKRIAKYLPAYDRAKATLGPIMAKKIGIQKMRENCPHFNNWLQKLEGLNC